VEAVYDYGKSLISAVSYDREMRRKSD